MESRAPQKSSMWQFIEMKPPEGQEKNWESEVLS